MPSKVQKSKPKLRRLLGSLDPVCTLSTECSTPISYCSSQSNTPSRKTSKTNLRQSLKEGLSGVKKRSFF